MACVGWGGGMLVKIAKKDSGNQKGGKINEKSDDDQHHGVWRD